MKEEEEEEETMAFYSVKQEGFDHKIDPIYDPTDLWANERLEGWWKGEERGQGLYASGGSLSV